MSWFEENKQSIIAVLKASFIFLVLFSMLVATAIVYDFSKVDTATLSFILAAIAIILLSNYVYDSSIAAYRMRMLSERRAKELVRSSEQLFMEVYDHSPVAYLVVNELGVVTSVNASASRLFAQSAERLLRQDVFSVLQAGADDHNSILRQKFEQGIVVADEDVKILRGTSNAWTKLSIFRFSDTEGKRLSLVTLVDITKQKEVETAKSEFVSLASHQLRTPISGMRWSAELLMMDGVESLTEQQKRYIDRLLSSINRMSTLVDDFLQVSRFELGTRVLKVEELNLSELCDDIIAEQVQKASEKRVKITREFDPAVVTIRTDQGLLRMIITNLYTNAVKYTRVGGDVVVSYERLSPGELKIQVRDSGMGIPIAEQQRVFSKIFRASNAVKEVPDGTGLGLYIVQKAVETLQGNITFTSAEDMGTTFTVVVPLE